MSKPNKANKNNYSQAGRLTPDEMARQLKQQAERSARAKERERGVRGRAPRAGERGASRPRSAPEE